jgi:hypothetical protein
MTDEIKEEIQENTEELKPEVKTLAITIEMPEPLRLLHWNLYQAAKSKYYADERRAGNTGDELTAKLHGAFAMIAEKYAKVEGLDDFEKMEPNEHLNLTVASLIVDFISIPLETAVNYPLSGLGQQYANISIVRNGIPVLNR